MATVKDVLRFGKKAAGYVHRRYTRRLMPVTSPVMHAGTPSIHDWRLLDKLLPTNFRPEEVHDIPDYEETLVQALRAHVKPGHRVVVVGGGGGVTAITAARLAGGRGEVICFEAASEQLAIIREALRRSAVDVELRYGAVGEAIGVYGENGQQAPVVAPEDLPECDVLELDCEGAERPILDRMTIRPPVVIVETHGVHGAPTNLIRAKLEALGYSVTDMGMAEPRLASLCVEMDVRVLLGVR